MSRREICADALQHYLYFLAEDMHLWFIDQLQHDIGIHERNRNGAIGFSKNAIRSTINIKFGFKHGLDVPSDQAIVVRVETRESLLDTRLLRRAQRQDGLDTTDGGDWARIPAPLREDLLTGRRLQELD